MPARYPTITDGLMDTLLEIAIMGLALRERYVEIKTHGPDAKYFTYVLLLRDGTIYCGQTDNIFARLIEHYAMTPSCAKWVREHGGVQRILEIVLDSSPGDEEYKMLEYCTLFGWHAVRGGTHCRVSAARAPSALADFVRDRSDFRYMTRDDVERVHATVTRLACGEKPVHPHGETPVKRLETA